MVKSVQHSVNLILPVFKNPQNQIIIIDDVMNSIQDHTKITDAEKIGLNLHYIACQVE